MDNLVSRSKSLIEGKGAGRRAAAKAPAPVTHVPDEPLHGGPEAVSEKALRTPSYNGFVTPVEASKNAHWYASRPLPATPTAKAKMTDRPNTSGGPGSKKAAKNDFAFDKRVSRDDFYVGSRTFGGNRSGPFAPLRVHPPTPDASPRTAPVPQFASKTSGLEPTSNHAREAYSADIGMALGSPSHPPDFSNLPNSQNVTQPRRRKPPPPIVSPPMSRSSSVDTFDMPISRKPTGKWKLFSIFSRKQSDQPVHAVSISDPNGLHGTNRPEDSQKQVSPGESGNPARSNTTSSRKVPKHKPIVVRSQTMPLDTNPEVYDQRPRAGERKGDLSFGRIPIALDTGSKPSLAKGPLLNVEIPDVRMERYSVMFNSVLNSNPSLLSRRQATVPKLRSIEDGVEKEEEERLRGMTRRATSPQPVARGSGLGLFPANRQPQNLEPHKLSPRLRSNTSPALLPSPSRATFIHKTPGSSYKLASEISSLKQHKNHIPGHHAAPGIAITEHSNTIGHGLSPPSPQFDDDHSNLILDSPTEIDSPSDDVIVWKPTTYQPPPEPKWQMISPSQKTPSTASSYTGSYRKRSPSLASSSRTHVTRPSEDVDDAFYADSTGNGSNGDSNNSKMTPVEISIARQISISRQQRKLLQPLRTGPSPSVSPGRKTSHAASARAGPMPGITVTESGRIAETKTATPTLVHPPGLLDPQASLAQHRKSERVVLEDA